MMFHMNPLFLIGATIDSTFNKKKPTPENNKQFPEQHNLKSLLDSEPSTYAWVNFQ